MTDVAFLRRRVRSGTPLRVVFSVFSNPHFFLFACHSWRHECRRDHPKYVITDGARSLRRSGRGCGEQANLTADVARESMTMWAAADCEMRVLNPSHEMAVLYARRSNADARELNNSSIVLLLVCGARSFLFAADIESDGRLRCSIAATFVSSA